MFQVWTCCSLLVLFRLRITTICRTQHVFPADWENASKKVRRWVLWRSILFSCLSYALPLFSLELAHTQQHMTTWAEPLLRCFLSLKELCNPRNSSRFTIGLCLMLLFADSKGLHNTVWLVNSFFVGWLSAGSHQVSVHWKSTWCTGSCTTLFLICSLYFNWSHVRELHFLTGRKTGTNFI